MRQLLLAAALLAACSDGKKDEAAARAAPADKKEGPPAYQVETVPPSAPCSRGAPCAIAMKITALRDYHVNEDYPTRFVAQQTPGVEPDGKGTFALQGKQAGTLTFTFRAANPGTVKISGELRLSVCNENECQIKSAPIAVDVPIS